MKKSKWLKCAVIAGIAVLLALVGEFLFYAAGQNHKNKETIVLTDNPSFMVSYQTQSGRTRLSEQEESGILLERENGRILAQLNGTQYVPKENENLEETEEGMYWKVKRTVFTITADQPLFIRNLAIECPPTEEGTQVLIQIERDGGWEEFDSFYVDERIHAGSCRLNQTVQSLQVTLSNVDAIDGSQVRLSVTNDVFLNPVRFLFVFAAILLIAFYGFNQDWFVRCPERVFALTALLLGSTLIYAIGTNQVGYDEHIHFAAAYNRSFLSRVETTESAMQAEAGTFPAFANAAERRLIEEYADRNHDYSWANITWQSRFPSYETRAYLPMSAGLLAGRLLSLPFAWCIMLARFCNLIFYTALVYAAIRMARQGKLLVAALGLIPNSLFAACVFSYDSVVNGFLLLAVVLTTNLLLERRTKITWLETLLVLGAFIAGSTAKLIYILMALILVFLGRERFGSRLRELLFKVSVVAICGFMIYTIFSPPVSASSNYELIGNLTYAADARAQGSNVLGQISYMMGNPLSYLKLLLSSMAGDFLYYLAGRKEFLNYGYLGGLHAGWMWLGIAALSMASVFAPAGERRRKLADKYRFLSILMILGVSAVIWTSMYISFTAVGSSRIEGVQGRYFLPLLLPFFYCLMNGKYHSPLKQAVYGKVILGVFAIMNLYAIAALAVVKCL